METLLKVRDITQSYKKGNFFSQAKEHYVLKNIHFSLTPNRNLGILGQNGAGKSSLVRILLGLERPKSGKVTILDYEYFQGKDKLIRQNIQGIFQDSQSALNPRLSARECILEGLANYNLITDKKLQSQKLANFVGLDPRSLDKKSAYFSGGEQQRIAIARAIALKPKILILDEALSNLDVHLQAKMIDNLKEIQHHFGITFIVISHDLRIILQLCQEIILLQKGEIIFQTTQEEGIKNAILRDKSGIFKEFFQASLQNSFYAS